MQGPWSPEEDTALIQLHARAPNKWAHISKNLEGRSDNDVKNHWYSVIIPRSVANPESFMYEVPMPNFEEIVEEHHNATTSAVNV